MSLIRLGFWAASGAGGFSYWLATLGGADREEGFSITTDSTGNSYALGITNSTGAGVYDFLLAKYDQDGIVQWQRVIGGASGEYGYGVAVDSSDNVYAVGYTATAGEGGIDLLIVKYNSSGTIQWQRILGGSGGEGAYSVAIDSADNVYFLGFTNSTGAGSNDFIIAKYNSSGTIQWQRVLGGSGSEEGRSIAIDSSDNVYVFGFTSSTGAGSNDFLLAKYNSSGTIQWQRVLGGSSSDQGKSIAIDSEDNVYLVGYTNSTGAGTYDFLLAKYNSSGTIQWQRVLGGASSDQGNSVAVDSSDNVYVLGVTESAGEGSRDFQLAKYNSSGTIQWQRTLGATSYEDGLAIAVDPSDNLYVFGKTGSTGAGIHDFLIGKLPNDGSLTGTYVLDGVDFVYAASSLTAATSTLTAATSSLTAATSSLTAATSSLPNSSESLTSSLVIL